MLCTVCTVVVPYCCCCCRCCCSKQLSHFDCLILKFHCFLSFTIFLVFQTQNNVATLAVVSKMSNKLGKLKIKKWVFQFFVSNFFVLFYRKKHHLFFLLLTKTIIFQVWVWNVPAVFAQKQHPNAIESVCHWQSGQSLCHSVFASFLSVHTCTIFAAAAIYPICQSMEFNEIVNDRIAIAVQDGLKENVKHKR